MISRLPYVSFRTSLKAIFLGHAILVFLSQTQLQNASTLPTPLYFFLRGTSAGMGAHYKEGERIWF